MNDNIIAYENGKLNEKEVVNLFQSLIDSGMVWKLQGHYGRIAMDLIESGLCTLGEKGHRDYYGNYIPSKYEVKEGTKGSIGYVKKLSKER